MTLKREGSWGRTDILICKQVRQCVATSQGVASFLRLGASSAASSTSITDAATVDRRGLCDKVEHPRCPLVCFNTISRVHKPQTEKTQVGMPDIPPPPRRGWTASCHSAMYSYHRSRPLHDVEQRPWTSVGWGDTKHMEKSVNKRAPHPQSHHPEQAPVGDKKFNNHQPHLHDTADWTRYSHSAGCNSHHWETVAVSAVVARRAELTLHTRCTHKVSTSAGRGSMRTPGNPQLKIKARAPTQTNWKAYCHSSRYSCHQGCSWSAVQMARRDGSCHDWVADQIQTHLVVIPDPVPQRRMSTRSGDKGGEGGNSQKVQTLPRSLWSLMRPNHWECDYNFPCKNNTHKQRVQNSTQSQLQGHSRSNT